MSDDQVSISKLKETTASFYAGILHDDPAVLQGVKAKIFDQIDKMQHDPLYRKQIAETLEKSKDLPNLTVGSLFSDILEQVSPSYRKVAETLKRIDHEVNVELGIDYKQLLQDLVNHK
ncbi:hypothetical protein EDM56_20540 [Brevibacillus fluminis]|uniref:Uncharacterized protein n=2 Tax=Brevibacillus fluminis TaxID=511487 RepID=A0A3M8DB20_9BACL|nr:hypothetical protein EDM56_20540 [Brevibacillus fluminis]